MAKAVKKDGTAKSERATLGVTEAPSKGGKASSAQAWAALAAQASPSARWAVPWFVLMQEASTASAFVVRHWTQAGGAGDAPSTALGLESVAKHLPASVADEILELQAAAQEAHLAYLLLAKPKISGVQRQRAELVLSEITAALEFLFDDGVTDQRDAQLAAVQGAHADDGESNAAIASALEDYASLARLYQSELDGLGGFDAAMLDEVAELVQALREPPSGGATDRSPETAAALAKRNGLGNLLYDRILRVRSAAQFVFRARPEIVREVTSTYLRRQRAAARRAAAAKAASPAKDTE